MQFKPFLLDVWRDQYEHGIEFNLAASTGPHWKVNEILDQERHCVIAGNPRTRFVYLPTARARASAALVLRPCASYRSARPSHSLASSGANFTASS